MLQISIISAEWDKQTGEIISVKWQAENVEHQKHASGTHVFCAKSKDDPSFVKLENVNEQTVIDWLKQDLDFEEIEKKLIEPAKQNIVPWE